MEDQGTHRQLEASKKQQEQTHAPPTEEPTETTTRTKNPVEKDEFKVYEKCPACNEKRYREEGKEDVFEYIEIGEHDIVNFYNKIAKAFNKIMWAVKSMMTGGCWASYHPLWVKKISHRFFWRIPWKYTEWIPRMKHWEVTLEGQFLLRCNVCRIIVLVNDPRDHVGIDFEEDVE